MKVELYPLQEYIWSATPLRPRFCGINVQSKSDELATKNLKHENEDLLSVQTNLDLQNVSAVPCAAINHIPITYGALKCHWNTMSS